MTRLRADPKTPLGGRRDSPEAGLHGVVENVVARIPGSVFAVDDNWRIQAWSLGIQNLLPPRTTAIRGRTCHELLDIVDSETGRDCHKGCPLASRSPLPGWVYSRVLDAIRSRGKRIRLDCLLLRCLTPDGQRSNLCFLEPTGHLKIETQSHVLQAIEAVYPVISGLADSTHVLAVSLEALLRATSGDGAEVFLLDPETGEPSVIERRGLSAKTMQRFRRSVIGDQFSRLIAGSRLPLLAVGPWPGSASDGGTTGYYLCAPLVAAGRVLGALGIVSRSPDFDVALAARVLFPVSAQLGAYLRWSHAGKGIARDRSSEPSKRRDARLQIHCLGTHKVILDGKGVPAKRFRRLKALTLLRYLAARRARPIPRETLMELLWPDGDPARTNRNLRVVLHALRRALEPEPAKGEVSSFVVSRGDLVYLEGSDRVWVDVEEFVQRARRTAALASEGHVEEAIAEYRHAASLYRGEYLEDEPYSDWCLFERERLKEIYINLTKQMATIFTEKGAVANAIDSYRAALRVDQGREEIHRELMFMLWKAGRRGEALRQYEACHTILREELDLEPAPETEALYKAMVAGADL